MTRMMTPTRSVGSVLLGSRAVAAALVRRHEDLIRRRCTPIACDAHTRAALYDLDTVTAELAAVPRRQRVA